MSLRTSVVAIRRAGGGDATVDHDLVAVEAPVSIALTAAGRTSPRPMGVLMRTPGDDDDLVRGWLFTEHIIHAASDILSLERTTTDTTPDAAVDRIVVTLAATVDFSSAVENRALTPTSACGLCGRLSVEAIDRRRAPAAGDARLRISAGVIASIPDALREGQPVFNQTGGLHAAGLFSVSGALVAVREDVGRHNAVDKLVGMALAEGWLPASTHILAVSGRIAFEIVQKAAAAGVAALVAVGAPSDLAIEAAKTAGLALVGFARAGRFNVYAGHERIDLRSL